MPYIYNYDAIKVEEVKFSDKSDEISKIYLASIPYEDLIKVGEVGNVATNRQVDEDRAKDMVKYLKKRESFYPPIIVTSLKKNIIKYDEQNKVIMIKKSVGSNKLIVIDGQHRFRSIEEYLTDINMDSDKKRKQSVLIIDNVSEFQQRKLFVDINDNAVSVSRGTKQRFEVNVSNYLSLNVLNDNEFLQKIILMDANQVKEGFIPYKFIVKGNKVVLKEIERNFKNNKIKINDLEILKPIFIKVWKMISDVMENLQLKEMYKKKDSTVFHLEVFYEAIFKSIEDEFKGTIYDIENKSIKKKINEDAILNGIQMICNSINSIESLYRKKGKLKTATEKRDILENIMRDLMISEEEVAI